MFMGHYGAAWAVRAIEPRLSLGAAFLAVQLVDVGWGTFVLLGIERSHLDPTLTSSPLVLEYVPWTHSLLGNVLLAGAAYGVCRAMRQAHGPSLAFAAAVLSHWVLDLIVHRPDLTLYGTAPYFGLRLWDWPAPALAVELGFIVGAAWVCFRRVGGSPRIQAGLAGLLVVLQLITFFGPVPPTIQIVAAAALVFYVGLPALAAWLGRLERGTPARAGAAG